MPKDCIVIPLYDHVKIGEIYDILCDLHNMQFSLDPYFSQVETLPKKTADKESYERLGINPQF